MIYFHTTLDYVLLALGLGFVIFFHELGHFLAAKYCKVKVEQFAVGFGPAIVAWRKGIGFRRGTTTPAYDKTIEEHFDASQKDQLTTKGKIGPTASQASDIGKNLGLGETEYRLNWVPLGGYVKMLGQDDLKPGAVADDPRAFNNKSVGARMVIVSAGVIMNVILAAIGFMIVFMMGYPVPPSIVGGVESLSPAAKAVSADGTRVGLQPGDQILKYNGYETNGDFSKIILRVALTREGTNVPVEVRHPDGKVQTLYVTPVKVSGLMMLGVDQPFELAGPDPKAEEPLDYAELARSVMPDGYALKPGDVITQISGKDVKPDDISALYAAFAAADGKPVDLTVKSLNGKISHRAVMPHFSEPFDKQELNFLGMAPRVMVAGISTDNSPAMGKLKPGDVILSLDEGSDHLQNPTSQQVMETLYAAGQKKLAVAITVLDPGSNEPRTVSDLTPNVRLGHGKIGLGIAIGCDEQHLVVAQTQSGSSASGKIPSGALLTAIDGHSIGNWFQVRRIIADSQPGQTLAISYRLPEKGSKPAVAAVTLSPADIQSAQQITLMQELPLRPMASPLQTNNPFIAVYWGVGETRDLILEFYLTLQRIFTGDVSLSNTMGPIGIVHAGAVVASRGIPWLLWFLCNISANLAVVNFLPIPIVDGGLFTLLILEKIQGKPLSIEAQRIVQMVGLVLILGVFLLVTYQDIARMYGY